MISKSSKLYTLLGSILFIGTFGINGVLVVVLSLLCFTAGFSYVVYSKGGQKSHELKSDFVSLLRGQKFPPGNSILLRIRNRFNDKSSYDQIHSMTNLPTVDAVLEQILSYIMRDYVDSWYVQLSNDELFKESLKRTSRRSIAALSQSMRQVDWVPFLTRHVVDDFASHLRLYRMATERASFSNNKEGKIGKEDDLLSNFFDFELEMEKNLCRDLLSTTPHYESAYLHDLVDIILYLIMPPEDFRCRPLRFLLREVIVRRLIVPLLDHFSDPNEINQLLVWLLSEVSPRPDDFVSCLDNSRSVDELESVLKSILEEKSILRGKDAGGEQGIFVKQQLSSLEYVESVIKRKITILSSHSVDDGLDVARTLDSADGSLVQLPIHVVLTNSVAVSFFIDYLQTVGGQNYIDLYLAIEGFKVSVEHQLRSLANGESIDGDVYETIKEAAHFMYQQYLSQEAITRVPLDDTVVAKFLCRLRKDEPSDYWFEHIQDKVVEVLRDDEHFYPAFKRSRLYAKMLAELGIIGDDERPETPISESSAYSGASEGKIHDNKVFLEGSVLNDGEPTMSAIVETLGIGQQGKQSFVLYNVRVNRSVNGKKISGWNVLRRYSDFHTLHTFVIQKYPKLGNLSFPGKKTFNNLDAHFLERRSKALNLFMECILQPSLLKFYPDLSKILFDFLSQKEYLGNREPITRKVMSAMFDPIRLGVKAVGTTVKAVPDQVYGGVSKVGAGINSAAKTIIQPRNNLSRAPVTETDRVAAAITDDDSMSESIPLRVLVLFVDEVFGVRARNAWFRRQMITVLRQFVTPFGTSINKRIVDLVHWLTSEQQVTMYLTALRDSLWPDGHLAGYLPIRQAEFHNRSRLLAKALMLSSLPDELRLILGADTTYQGITAISDALQNRHLNRRLLYVLLERLLIVVFPENRFEKIFAQLHSKSPRSNRI